VYIVLAGVHPVLRRPALRLRRRRKQDEEEEEKEGRGRRRRPKASVQSAAGETVERPRREVRRPAGLGVRRPRSSCLPGLQSKTSRGQCRKALQVLNGQELTLEWST
jgi:hypothetical protein